MAADVPTRDDLTGGTTVEIAQANGDRLVGDVRLVLSDTLSESGGIEAELRSGVRRPVKQISPAE